MHSPEYQPEMIQTDIDWKIPKFWERSEKIDLSLVRKFLMFSRVFFRSEEIQFVGEETVLQVLI